MRNPLRLLVFDPPGHVRIEWQLQLTQFRTADAGYLTRRLVDVSQDVIVRTHDCGTTEGVAVHRVLAEGEVIEPIGERMHGRVALCTITDPETGEIVVEFDTIITRDAAKRVTEIESRFVHLMENAGSDEERTEIEAKFLGSGFQMNEHSQLSALIRSPLSCELTQGICSKCYGIDLSTSKFVDVGVAVGIIAAQSIGEPGTQLTMRTFHTGGVAGSATIAATNQYKTGKFIRQFMEDFAAATDTDLKQFDPTKLLESQEQAVKQLFTQREDMLVIENEAAPDSKKAVRQTKAAQKALEKADSDSKKKWDRARKTFFYSWTGQSSGIVRVEEIFEARRQPRGKAIICPVTGVVRQIQTSQYGRWVTIEATVPVVAIKDAYIADHQDWTDSDAALDKLVGQKLSTAAVQVLRKHEIEQVNIYYPILVPPLGNLPVHVGSRVIKGDPITEGPRDPHEVLALAGAAAVYDYFVENLQAVYKSQGVDINDKHIEVIIRQMLRKRQVKEPGDTPFLPGQIVDRFTFQKANETVREALQSGKKIKYIDPITGENVERDPKEATGEWILLGITEASLATESFLSAASFQKTTRVLTEAAVRGKKDNLVGLKENVIIGRLIPAGTGTKSYRSVALEVEKGPTWANQSLTALVEAGDTEDDYTGSLAFPTLQDITFDDIDDED